jgi:hypothetical protein
VTYSGFVGGENSAVLGGSLSYAGTAQGAINAGSYTITPQGLTSGNYAVSFSDGNLIVNPARLTIAANNAVKTYDATAFSGGNGVTYSGFVGGENSAVLGGSLSYAGTAQGAVNVGSYAITPQGLTSGNYAVSFSDGNLFINSAPLTITANNAARTYDATAFSGGNGVTYSGFVGGETSSVLGGSLSYAGTAQGAVNAGSYAIAPQGVTSTNYAIAFENGILTIKRDTNLDNVEASLMGGTQQNQSSNAPNSHLQLMDPSTGSETLIDFAGVDPITSETLEDE